MKKAYHAPKVFHLSYEKMIALFLVIVTNKPEAVEKTSFRLFFEPLIQKLKSKAYGKG